LLQLKARVELAFGPAPQFFVADSEPALQFAENSAQGDFEGA
jgi:hypothetical protein